MPSAEELFPILVYLLIGANPSYIGLNLDYIDKYMQPSRKVAKEGYVLTSLATALSFLEKIDTQKLLEGKLAMVSNSDS